MGDYNIQNKIFGFKLFSNLFSYLSTVLLGVGMLSYLAFWIIENGAEVFDKNPQSAIIRIVVVFFGTLILIKILSIIGNIISLVYNKIYLESLINRNTSISHALKIVLNQYWSFFRLTVYKLKLESAKFYYSKYTNSRLKDFIKDGGPFLNSYISNTIISKSLIDEKPFTNFNLDSLYDHLFSKEKDVMKSIYLSRYAPIKHKKIFFLNPIMITITLFLIFSFLNFQLTFISFISLFSIGFIIGILFSYRIEAKIDYYNYVFYLTLLNYNLPHFNQLFFESKNYIDSESRGVSIKSQYQSQFKYFLLIFPVLFIVSPLLIYLMDKEIISQFSMATLFFFIFGILAFFIFYKINKNRAMLELYGMAAFFDKNIMFTPQEQKYITALQMGVSDMSKEEIKKMPGSLSRDFRGVKDQINRYYPK